jgi:hypothetical protein
MSNEFKRAWHMLSRPNFRYSPGNSLYVMSKVTKCQPVPQSEQSDGDLKPAAEIVGSNPTRGVDVCLL